jgi:hypothetical protein
MDSRRFDLVTRKFYRRTNRRAGLRVLLAGILAETLEATFPINAAACKSRGDRCQKDNQCCSGQCVDRKPQKNKKAKKGKKARKNRKPDAEGICDCSGLQERCKGPGDCCSAVHMCRATSCSDVPVCCKGPADPCVDDCDCCDDHFCDRESGRCEDCGELKKTRQGPCETTDDCCFEGDICKSIDPTCEGREGDSQCCVPVGNECDEDCDCCVPLKCASGVCALQDGCSGTGQACSIPGPDGCCVTGDVCSTAVCNGGVEVVCCHTSGPCDDDCDCCGPIECVNGVCGGAS